MVAPLAELNRMPQKRDIEKMKISPLELVEIVERKGDRITNNPTIEAATIPNF